jgi:hypothetical protein
MAYYLLFCLISFAIYVKVIGWRRVFRWDSVAGFYLLSFFLVFFLRPWYVFVTEFNRLFFQLGVYPPQDWWVWDELLRKLNLTILLGLLCFALAYRQWAPREPGATSGMDPSPELLIAPELRKKLMILSLVFAGLGIASILYYCPLPGIRDVHVAEWVPLPDGTGSGLSHSTGYLVHASLFIIPAAIILFLASQNIFLTLAIVTPLILFQLWWGFGRQVLVQLSLSLLLAAGLGPKLHRRKNYFSLACALTLLLGAAAAFGVLGEERTAVQSYIYTRSGPVTRLYESSKHQYLYSLVGFEISLHWLKFTPEVFPYQWGANYLYQLFILPIPRILWPNKRNLFASFTPASYVEDMSYLYGCAPSCIGDAWMNGGWLGLIVIFALTGTFCALVQRAKDWRPYPVTGLVIFISTYPMVITLVRDGLGSLPPFLYFFGLPIISTFLVEKSWRKSNSNIRKAKPTSSGRPAPGISGPRGLPG